MFQYQIILILHTFYFYFILILISNYIYFKVKIFEVNNNNCLSIVTYFKLHLKKYNNLLTTVTKYIKLQSLKKFSSIDALTDVLNHPLFVCIHINFILYTF